MLQPGGGGYMPISNSVETSNGRISPKPVVSSPRFYWLLEANLNLPLLLNLRLGPRSVV